MRIARFSRISGSSTEPSFGLVEGPLDADEADLVVSVLDGHPFGKMLRTGEVLPLSAVRLLAPVLPSKILGIGKNYADHVAEMAGLTDSPTDPGTPLVFLKPATAVTGPGDPIPLPRWSERVDFEGELAIVIGRLCRDVPASRFAEVVLGYTCANDVTARDKQASDGQWARAKGADGFCPLGPWIETALDPSAVEITTTVDGVERQRGNTRDLIHDLGRIVEHVSSFTTLLPGDVILTGTPAGVGPLHNGERVTVTVAGLGSLTNPVLRR